MAGTPLEKVCMRCWTYINRGYRSGNMQSLNSRSLDITGYLGSQKVFVADPVSHGAPYNKQSVAPNTTSLAGGYHQLLAMEWRALGPSATVGIVDGFANSELLMVDMKNTLLPFPVVAQREPSAVRFNYSAAAADAGAQPPSPSPSPLNAAPAAGRRRRRELLQLPVAAAGYRAQALGASAYSMSQVSTPGVLVAQVYQPTAAALYESTPYLGTLVLNSIAWANASAPEDRASAWGLAGALPGAVPAPAPPPPRRPPPPLKGRPPPPLAATAPSGGLRARYVRAQGFLRLPSDATPGSRAMRVWNVRVRCRGEQALAISLGDVTLRNGVEFPCVSLNETLTEVVLPPGFVPTAVMLRSRDAGVLAELDVALLDPAAAADGGEETAVGGSMWYQAV
ncbi:hypothetical protein TSOC_002757 [Tetrabaena socialis]|uniref:Uncharacterized protein n=1 Tax=Tetrabaena socialis TaxID=47790 RepID=A0A2J8ADC2_9CHLO|nr:hypothetical protein TSOC_002757 [Tetrabaena socialis]|eukprot:PNH10515.1 hypothetical protein TSOC_002757 [Tetrabaena socialis]